MRKVILGLAALLLSDSSSMAEECDRRGGYYLSHDANYPMFITIKAGTTCEATFRARGNLVFKRLLLVSAPARGKIRLREGGFYIYSAPPSAGSDKFTLRVCGSENNSNGCATLDYSVTVQ